MTEAAGGDGSSSTRPTDGVPDAADADADIPKTRQHGEVAPAISATTLGGELTYPDDGPVSSPLRKLDRVIGHAEQALLFLVLFIVVLTASAHAIIEKLTEQGIWWSYDVVRGGTFVLAMIGAAFATSQSKHLAMDLLSRRLPPRGRLVLQALLELFTITICIVLVHSGMHQVAAAGKETGRHLIEAADVAMFLPIGAALISIHAALHLIINIEYLLRGRLLPERARSGH